MSQERRHFTDEFKREAVALLASSGRPLIQIASELGIAPSMLRNWRHRSTGGHAGSAPHSRAASALPCVLEPENRLVARSLERVWEERLRRVDQIEHEYDAWRRQQAVTISESDQQEILRLGSDLPRLWSATTTRSADRKQIIRLVIKEVAL